MASAATSQLLPMAGPTADGPTHPPVRNVPLPEYMEVSKLGRGTEGEDHRVLSESLLVDTPGDICRSTGTLPTQTGPLAAPAPPVIYHVADDSFSAGEENNVQWRWN